MDEIMRSMQGSLDKTRVERLRSLSVWVGVAALGLSKLSIGDKLTKGRKLSNERETVMARVIVFYTPKSFRRQNQSVPNPQPAKVIAFGVRTTRSA